MLKKIEIPIADELVQIYDLASEREKAELVLLVNETIRRMGHSNSHPLLIWADKMSSEAQMNGLTPEILEELLASE